MVILPLNAHAKCDAKGCDARTPVRMVLTGAGGFGFVFDAGEKHGWQVVLPGGNVGAPYRTLCPEHHQRLQVIGPAGPPGAA